MRRWVLVAGVAALGFTGSAVGRDLPVEWISPRAGAVWTAGETVTLEWRATAPWPRGLDVEEWEAFLSLDSGRTFPIRLTPHLEADLRTVRLGVPALPTEHARLLLRFGNERREIEWLLPGEFRIAAAGTTDVHGVAALALERLAWARGEAARAGERGVVLWAEGRRDGGDWRVASAAPASTFAPAVENWHGSDEASATSESSSTDADQRPSNRFVPAAASLRAPRASPRSRREVSILRLIERQNE